MRENRRILLLKRNDQADLIVTSLLGLFYTRNSLREIKSSLHFIYLMIMSLN